MAKIVLAFEGKILRDFALEKAETLIGRDAECDIRVDSLHAEPRHARIVRTGDDYRIVAENPAKPLLVHHVRTTEQALSHDDLIQLGQYTLTFVEDQYNFLQITQSPASKPQQPAAAARSGYLQVLTGPRAGRVIALKQSLTRLGLTHEESVLVAHRREGYFLSQLKGAAYPQVNGRTIGEEAVQLQSGDELTIGLTLLKFFIE